MQLSLSQFIVDVQEKRTMVDVYFRDDSPPHRSVRVTVFLPNSDSTLTDIQAHALTTAKEYMREVLSQD